MNPANRTMIRAHRAAFSAAPDVCSTIRNRVLELRSARLRSDDILVTSYPRSGSTWLRFMLCALLADVEPTFNNVREYIPPVDRLRRRTVALLPGSRLVKSHEPPHSVVGLRTTKMLYLVRDVRDVALSYHQYRIRSGLSAPAEFGPFLERFIEGRIDGYGAWRAHAQAALLRRQRFPNTIQIIRYEDLLRDPAEQLREICQYIGAVIPSPRFVTAVAAGDRSRGTVSVSGATSSVRVDTADAIPREYTTPHRMRPEESERLTVATGDLLEAFDYDA